MYCPKCGALAEAVSITEHTTRELQPSLNKAEKT